MKNLRFSAFLTLIAAVLFLASCNKPIEKKVAGTWKIDDVTYKADSNIYNPAQLDQIIESQKTLRFELSEDKTMKVVTGSTTIEGNWIYKDAEKGVYIVYKGRVDTMLMGIYEKGKLINHEVNPDIEITTTFVKE